jgi:ribonuclease HI
MSSIKKALHLLLQKFQGDEDALEAIDYLFERAEELEDYEEEDVAPTGGEFPLPREFKGDYVLFSDGACRGNPGPGAWGVMGQDNTGDLIFQASGLDMATTNNRMELEGAIKAIECLVDHDPSNIYKKAISLYSDSRYVVDGIEKWVPGWKSRGWKKADKKVPENVELWQQLDQLVGNFKNLRFYWVKGHSGHPQNEYCDQLANRSLDEAGL